MGVDSGKIQQIHDTYCKLCEEFDGKACRKCGCGVKLMRGKDGPQQRRWRTAKLPQQPATAVPLEIGFGHLIPILRFLVTQSLCQPEDVSATVLGRFQNSSGTELNSHSCQTRFGYRSRTAAIGEPP